MKKLINHPQNVVPEMMEGLLAIYPHVSLLANHHVLIRSDADEVRDRQVAVVSGGGSGHEPAHAGFVGRGMLSAAVAGEVFTSPNPESIVAAIRAVAGSPGVLLIVKNYTGDRLNFGLAAEIVRSEGIAIETVVVADDVALAGIEQPAGARGIAGTILVHKVAGAAAGEGRNLADVAAVAQATAEAVATMGVSLSAGTVPAVGKPSYTLGEQEIELGLGIHGEPGVRRAPLGSADELAGQLIEAIVCARPLAAGERIALLVNNLGATTPMELAIVARRAMQILISLDIAVERVYSGTFISSLDAAGISLSVLRLDDERLRLLDAPTAAPAWPNPQNRRPEPVASRILGAPGYAGVNQEARYSASKSSGMSRAIEAACDALIEAESRLTELDRATGDGDLGTNLARAANAVKAAVSSYPLENAAETLRAVGLTVQSALGGSSGPLYGVFLLRPANSFQASDSKDATAWAKAVHVNAWAKAVQDGCDAISSIGGAQPGDRTMLDALAPFARAWLAALDEGRSSREALEAAVRTAEQGAAATAGMFPRRGRSSYLGERVIGLPDPGAVAVAIWLRAVVSAIDSRLARD